MGSTFGLGKGNGGVVQLKLRGFDKVKTVSPQDGLDILERRMKRRFSARLNGRSSQDEVGSGRHPEEPEHHWCRQQRLKFTAFFRRGL